MSNYSLPVRIDLAEAGEIFVAYEDVNGTGTVEIRWRDEQSSEQIAFAAPHYDTVLRLVEVLLWAARAAREQEQSELRGNPLRSLQVITPEQLYGRVIAPGERFQIIANGEIQPTVWVMGENGVPQRIDPPQDENPQ